MSSGGLQRGYRFILQRDVDRFPDFVARKGMSGTVIDILADGMVIGLIDQHIDGAEEWENQVWWESAFLADTIPLARASWGDRPES